jgi:structure-specific recognition protein 1
MASTVGPTHQFNNITLGGRIGGPKGVLKLSSSIMFWKTEGGRTATVSPADHPSKANWIRITNRTFQLKLSLKGGSAIKFDGFREADFDVLKSFLKDNFRVELEPQQISTKGVNWGEFSIQGPMLCFTVDGKQAFEIPLSEVSNAQIPANQKNEVMLEFHPDSTLDMEDESMVDIRFFIPNKPKEDGASDDAHKEKTPAQIFHQTILERADIAASAGKGIVQLSKIPILTPRGRYDIEMFPTFMKLHGKTYDYNIAYDTVSRLFQLPRPDQHHVFFIASLDPPIRQGQTRYPHLVMQFVKDEKQDLTINLPPEIKEKFKDFPTEFNQEETYSIINKLFHTLTGRKVTTPSAFKSHQGWSAIKCAFKANDGYLYPLERSFFFVHKPPTYIRFDEIANVEFARVSSGGGTSSNRTFDLVVTVTDGGQHQFTGILRQEYSSLFNFILAKKIRIVNPDDMEVDSMDAEPSAKAKSRVDADEMQDNEDEDESEDEDFVAADEDDVPEEFDEDYKSDGGDDEEEELEDKSKKDKGKGKEKEKGKGKGKKEKEQEKSKDKGKDKVKDDDKRKPTTQSDGKPPKQPKT